MMPLWCIMLPLWYHYETIMVPWWYHTGTTMYDNGTILIPSWYHVVPLWYHKDTMMCSSLGARRARDKYPHRGDARLYYNITRITSNCFWQTLKALLCTLELFIVEGQAFVKQSHSQTSFPTRVRTDTGHLTRTTWQPSHTPLITSHSGTSIQPFPPPHSDIGQGKE